MHETECSYIAMYIYQYIWYTLLAASKVWYYISYIRMLNVVAAHCYVNDIKWSHLSLKQRSTMHFSDDKGILG